MVIDKILVKRSANNTFGKYCFDVLQQFHFHCQFHINIWMLLNFVGYKNIISTTNCGQSPYFLLNVLAENLRYEQSVTYLHNKNTPNKTFLIMRPNFNSLYDDNYSSVYQTKISIIVKKILQKILNINLYNHYMSKNFLMIMPYSYPFEHRQTVFIRKIYNL